MNGFLAILCAILLTGPTWAWGQGTQGAAETHPAEKLLKLSNLRIDLTRRQITIPAEVCLRKGPLEFLLCGRSTKEHESVLVTDVLPSQLHAALLSLGLTPGKPARWIDLDTDEDSSGRFLPPQGPALRIQCRWNDNTGKTHKVDAESFLSILTPQRKPQRPTIWIFVGSQMLPDNRYQADIDGEIVSVANFASSVIDVPFESSSKNAMLDFAARTEAIPSVNTPVEVVIMPLPGASSSPHARVVLEIDRFGRLHLDGEPTTFDELRHEAQRYIARHRKGQVIIRATGDAIIHDVELAREILQSGGVKDIQDQYLQPKGHLPPRTNQQARRSLEWWAERFANAEDLIIDPAEDAEAMLRQIDKRIRELESVKAIWTEYAENLRAAMKRYRAMTQPTSGDEALQSAPTRNGER